MTALVYCALLALMLVKAASVPMYDCSYVGCMYGGYCHTDPTTYVSTCVCSDLIYSGHFCEIVNYYYYDSWYPSNAVYPPIQRPFDCTLDGCMNDGDCLPESLDSTVYRCHCADTWITGTQCENVGVPPPEGEAAAHLTVAPAAIPGVVPGSVYNGPSTTPPDCTVAGFGCLNDGDCLPDATNPTVYRCECADAWITGDRCEHDNIANPAPNWVAQANVAGQPTVAQIWPTTTSAPKDCTHFGYGCLNDGDCLPHPTAPSTFICECSDPHITGDRCQLVNGIDTSVPATG